MFNKPASAENTDTINTVVIPSPSEEPPQPEQSSNKLLLIIGGVALVIGLGIFMYMMNMSQTPPAPSPTPVPATPAPTIEPEGVMCTMEAKICPDGSAVGRTGPNCEFAACPGEEMNATSGGQLDTTTDIDLEVDNEATTSTE